MLRAVGASCPLKSRGEAGDVKDGYYEVVLVTLRELPSPPPLSTLALIAFKRLVRADHSYIRGAVEAEPQHPI